MAVFLNDHLSADQFHCLLVYCEQRNDSSANTICHFLNQHIPRGSILGKHERVGKPSVAIAMAKPFYV